MGGKYLNHSYGFSADSTSFCVLKLKLEFVDAFFLSGSLKSLIFANSYYDADEKYSDNSYYYPQIKIEKTARR